MTQLMNVQTNQSVLTFVGAQPRALRTTPTKASKLQRNFIRTPADVGGWA